MDTKRSRTRHRAIAAGVAVLLSLTAACSGGSSDSSDEDSSDRTTTSEKTTSTTSTTTTEPRDPVAAEERAAYVEALAATYGGEAAAVLDLAQAACVAEAWVTTIGEETFASSGVTSAQLAAKEKTLRDVAIDEETGEQMGADMTDCGVELRSFVYQSLGPAVGQANVRACVDQALSDEDVLALVISQATALPPPTDAFKEAVECFPG